MSPIIRCRVVMMWMVAFFGGAMAQAADLGTKVFYKKDTPVQFGAFSLTFVGERRVALEKYPRGFLYYDFRVTSPHGTQTISWSSGTGEIAPLLFKVGNEGFELELQRSDKLGKLKENELVVSRAP
jgi:hypothetical protein